GEEVLEERVDDPLLKGKQIAFEEEGGTRAPSSSKQIEDQQTNMMRESDDDEYFKFISDTFGKPMMNELEDIFQNQADLQECTIRY
uniref:Uncharacterized protein n=1 Tax=Cucumis melo TaxID=3656 RepID=A0A9I9CBX5_CUCME